jgi:hypothetical protein
MPQLYVEQQTVSHLTPMLLRKRGCCCEMLPKTVKYRCRPADLKNVCTHTECQCSRSSAEDFQLCCLLQCILTLFLLMLVYSHSGSLQMNAFDGFSSDTNGSFSGSGSMTSFESRIRYPSNSCRTAFFSFVLPGCQALCLSMSRL